MFKRHFDSLFTSALSLKPVDGTLDLLAPLFAALCSLPLACFCSAACPGSRGLFVGHALEGEAREFSQVPRDDRAWKERERSTERSATVVAATSAKGTSRSLIPPFEGKALALSSEKSSHSTLSRC